MVLRLYDLTDQPLEFHPTRQLRGALIARGMYYQMLPSVDPETRETAVSYGESTARIEPPILERLVAYTYLLTGEQLWVARLYSILFWTVGGVFVYLLTRRMLLPPPGAETTPQSGHLVTASALISLAYFLVLPFAVQASRTFQPDPLMVMWIILAAYALFRWSEAPNWKWAILSGIFAGLAVLVKAVAAYLVAGAAVAVVLNTLGLKRFWRSPQVYAMAALMVSPTILRYINRGSLTSEYVTNWTVALSHLLLEPGFYIRWLGFVQNLVGLAMLLLGLVGVAISRPRSRALLLGLWFGYFIYGLTLPYQMFTHSYYHLQLVPIIALSLAPVAEIILARVAQERRIWQAFFVGAILIALVNASWLGIFNQYADDHRSEPAYWQAVASQLPKDGKIIALTQDYGFPLMYYGWRKVDLWPNRGEQKLMKLRGSEKEFEEYFLKQTEGKSYFLITSFSQFNAELDLKQYLSEHYPVLATEEDYIIFDLRNSLP